MNSKLVLPLKKSFTTTFAPHADAVGMLLNYPSGYPWLMNNFIQLTCWGNQYLDFYDFNHRDCPLLFCQKIKKEFLDCMGIGLIDFIGKALSKNYYIMLPVETKYISAYDFSDIHEMFIYGHVDMKQFYIADNFSRGKYATEICSEEELLLATNNMANFQTWKNGFNGSIELLSYQDEIRANFELYRVIESIQDYLSSSATRKWYVNYAMWNSSENANRCFGMQCYDGVFNNIHIAKIGGYFADSGHRALFLEWEHKKIMGLRLEWIKKTYYISDEIILECNKLEEKSRIALNLKLKYDITKDKKILDRIEDIYKIIRENEENLLIRLLKELENY